MQINQGLDQVESDAGAGDAGRRARPEKTDEQVIEFFARNADTFIADIDFDMSDVSSASRGPRSAHLQVSI